VSAIEVRDALGQSVAMKTPPQRIVSLVPSQTELLHHLGLEDRVVGLTRYCVRPPHWSRTKTIVGGTKKVRSPLVAALRPDLILANKEENTEADVEALRAIAPVYVTDVSDLAGAVAMVRALGELTDRRRTAERCADEIERRFSALEPGPELRAAYLIWKDPIMTVGADTFIHDIMKRAGLANVFAHMSRYPTLTPEALASANPEVVLLSSEPYPFGASHLQYFTSILPSARIILADGELFSWYGSRMISAPEELLALRTSLL
jgi:ABC-type Fe3+-hydroxamate transport system substrate-binding protein